ncbi:MAG: isochorismatase family protein [Betaproteobacteria bacterium]|nr:MAG: isochorismatase family protein [Betaproteobacteria bacterium]
MSAERLDAARTCLLLFDFLVGHASKDPKRYAPVLANAAKLLAAARGVGAMVAYARADHRADGGTTARTLHDSGPRSPLITSGTPEADHGTYLDLALRSRHANTIVLCGGSTEIGVSSTAYAARDLDYNLVIASDACTSAKHEVHDRLMREVFPRLARVRTTMQILEMLKP